MTTMIAREITSPVTEPGCPTAWICNTEHELDDAAFWGYHSSELQEIALMPTVDGRPQPPVRVGIVKYDGEPAFIELTPGLAHENPLTPAAARRLAAILLERAEAAEDRMR